MRNATIATSRTRATSDQLIDYRPLPAAWGDVDALHELRNTKARAAEHGIDPSTLEIAAIEDAAQDGHHRRPRGVRRTPAGRTAPLALLRRARGTHARRSHGTGGLATA